MRHRRGLGRRPSCSSARTRRRCRPPTAASSRTGSARPSTCAGRRCACAFAPAPGVTQSDRDRAPERGSARRCAQRWAGGGGTLGRLARGSAGGGVAKEHPAAADVTEEFESLAERFAGWTAAHPGLAVGIAAAVLAAAGAYGAWSSWRHSRAESGSDALDAVRVAYLEEMGAPPGAVDVPELANPKAAQEIRERYLARFREVADAQRGTSAGTLALFESADLLQALGRRDEIAAVYAEALANAPTPELAAFVQRRIP